MKTLCSSVIVLCCMLIVVPLYAENTSGANSGHKAVESQKMALGAWRGTQLMGITVYGADDKRVGTIADMVGDVKGQIIYLVLSHGGILGIGDKLIPLPWALISPGEKPGTLKVQLTKEALEQAPNFDSNNWPDFTRSDWKEKTEKYYDSVRSQKKAKSK